MSNQNHQFKSLIQLVTYSGIEEFLKQYHDVIKEEFGQKLGINKALICLSKVFANYENKHQMIADLKSKEKEVLFKIKKEIFFLTDLTQDGSVIESNDTYNFTSFKALEIYVKDVFEECCITYDLNIVEIIEHLENYIDEDLIEEIKKLDSVYEVFELLSKSNIDAYEYISIISAISYEKRELEINSDYLEIDVSLNDIEF
jgi:hypothetical protein